MKVGPNDRVRVTREVHVREFDGDLVILDLAKGDYFGIDEIGARLWRGLERGQSCEEIAGALIVDYDTDRERLLTDLLNLANELLVKGLVELADEA